MNQWMRALAVLATVSACGPEGPTDGGPSQADASQDATTVTLCTADADCDDGRFCNGFERCMPGAEGAEPNGCVAGTPPCEEEDFCHEESQLCLPDVCADGGDADGDGDARPECGGGDCDDENPNVHSHATEWCDPDGVDEDCDPRTIHNEQTRDGDQDGDGFIDRRCFNVRSDGTVNRGTDCDDARPTVNPAGIEACDLIDNDCDGLIDEGVQNIYYFDLDNDGYGRSDEFVWACTRPEGYALFGGDCDDGQVPSPYSSSVNPGATEVCNGRDDDCDGITDPGCACVDGETLPCGIDIGACELGTQTCADGEWGPCLGGVGPTTEVCGGGDEDCDGRVDEEGAAGERVYYRDADGDGYGNPDVTRVACPGPGGAPPTGYVENDRDCADTRPDVHPGAGYGTQYYCRQGVPCSTGSTGRCAESVHACGRGSYLPRSVESFDLNCDGNVDIEPRGECGLDKCVFFRTGPVDTKLTAEDCGQEVVYLLGCQRGRSGCELQGRTQPLACR